MTTTAQGFGESLERSRLDEDDSDFNEVGSGDDVFDAGEIEV